PRTGDEAVVEAPLDAALHAQSGIEQRHAAVDVVVGDADIAAPVGGSCMPRRERRAHGEAEAETGARASRTRPTRRVRPDFPRLLLMVANWSHAVPVDAPPVFADARRP